MSKKLNLTPFQWALSVISCGALFSLLGTVALSFADNNPATSNIATSSTLVVPYEGYLMLDSTPLNGTQQMKFSLYEAASGGTVQWIEAQDVAINAGRFSVALGTGTKDASITQTFSEVVLDAQQLYLAISVYDANAAAWVDLSGRQAIEAVPYAAWSANSADFKVEGALTVTGLTHLKGGTQLDGTTTVTGLMTADENITAKKNLTINGNIAIDGTTTMTGQVKSNGDFTAEQNVKIKGNLQITNTSSQLTAPDIIVTDDLTVADDVNILGDLIYTGKLTGLETVAATTAGSGNFSLVTRTTDLRVNAADGFCFLTGVRFFSGNVSASPSCQVSPSTGKWMLHQYQGTFGSLCEATCITY